MGGTKLHKATPEGFRVSEQAWAKLKDRNRLDMGMYEVAQYSLDQAWRKQSNSLFGVGYE